MDTKNQVLNQLERSRGLYVSGEQMAQRLDLSRNMIWRAIGALRADGYEIEAVTNKGYRLTGGDVDRLTADGIRAHLWNPALADCLELHGVVESTNRLGKQRALDADQPAWSAHGAIILADGQSAGRGRHGRQFHSPAGAGLYMSFVLDPDRLGFRTPTAITAHAAVCVCEAVESVCGLSPGIKWVNDILLDGKKIGGILTEALSDFESGAIHSLVLGVGLNLTTHEEDFPEALRGIAGSLDPQRERGISRNRLAAEIINRVLSGERVGEAALFGRYRERLTMLGSEVTVSSGRGEEPYTAIALDIDQLGRLVVRTPEGRMLSLSSGEISVNIS